jgi:hypothetical protein
VPSAAQASGREPRISVRKKAFVDFCEVPEVGDVNEQNVLYVDGAPLLRGSRRRVGAVARELQLRVQGASGISCPRLSLTHLTVDAQESVVAQLVPGVDATLFAVLAFGGVTVTGLRVAGHELPLAELPVAVAARAQLEVTVHNGHDEALQVELLACYDEAPTG